MGTDDADSQQTQRLHVSAVVEIPAGAPSAPSSYQRERDRKQDRSARADRVVQALIFFATLAASFAAGVAATYAYRTWSEAKRSADAAWEGVRATKDALERESKARIEASGFQVPPDIDATEEHEFRVSLENVGGGPAENIRIVLFVDWAAMDVADGPPSASRKPPTVLTYAIMRTNTPLHVAFGPATFSEDAILSLREGGSSVALWGWIEYDDGVSPVRQFTEFCGRYNPPFGKRKMQVANCAQGNRVQ